MKKLTILAAACLALAACGSDSKPGNNAAAVAEPELTGNTGQVLSVIQVPGYTYVEVRNNDGELWLAGNPIEVEEGEIISWADSAMMRNFQSKALDRTFDELLFVSAIYKAADGAPQPAANMNSGVVRSTETAAGYTYLELETDSGEVISLATQMTSVAPGDRVSWQGGSVMTNFKSTSLDKTFPEILFVQSISIVR